MSTEWIYTSDIEGQTPLDRAIRSNHMALCELLLKQESEDDAEMLKSISLLHKAAYLGLEEAIRTMLDEGADPNEIDEQGETPLHKAAREGHCDAVNALIEFGADVNAVNVMGMTPLHWVALNGRSAVAALLIDAGADPDLSDDYLDNLSPVEVARLMEYEEIVYIFEKHPPDVL